MPDDAAPLTVDRDLAEQEAERADARLVRGVRWRLVLWSGGATLVVLLVLGVALYAAVANSLAATSVRVLEERVASELERRPGPGSPPLEFRLQGDAAGTFGFFVDPDGEVISPRNFDPPEGLPDEASIQAARDARRDVREVTAGTAPVRVLSQAAQDQRGGQWVIQVIQGRSEELRTLKALVTVLVVGGLVALLVASLLGAVYARRALVPIRSSLKAQRRALQRQREFAADASHELRTPLTVVRSSVEHLRRHAQEPIAQVGTALDDIEAEVAHLGSLVDDLLLLARSDSGALDVSLQPVELGDVAAEAASAMAVPAADRGVRVEVDPVPAMVVGDPLRLRQLITILVDNAVRHSPSGATVGVRVRREGRDATVTVEDQGPGIRIEDLPHVFDRFWRASGAPGGGTGLGLAIAATIVTRLGGRIGVANRPSGGASFTVVLPLMGSVQHPVAQPSYP
jgi:signal transduction histidine kinase